MPSKNIHREKELNKRRFRVETKKRLGKLPITLAEESVRRLR